MFSRFKLVHKLLLSYLALALLVCATGVIGALYVSAVGARGVRVGEELAPLADAAMEIQLAGTRAHLALEEIVSGDESEGIGLVWERVDEARWYCDAILDGAQNSEGTFVASDDPEVRAAIVEVKRGLDSFEVTARERYTSRAGPGSEADGTFDDEYRGFITRADAAEAIIQTKMLASMDDLRRFRSNSVWAMIVAMLIAVGVAMSVGVLVARSITRPVVKMADSSKAIAAGDLREELDGGDDEAVQGDEIGVLRRAFSSMRTNIREVMQNIQAGATDLAARSAQVGTTAREYGTTAAEQATAVTEITTTIEEIKQTSKAAAASAQGVVRASEEAVETGQRGLDAIAESTRMTEVISERVEVIAQKILQLNQQNSQIGEIVETVKDLADQSNLLAVNASIEAAKAGEQGRGFAVVAAEVRSLADQSKRATQQIRAILAEIQQATESAVMAAEEGSKRATDGREAIASVRVVVEELAATLETNSDRARQIAGAAGQQVAGIEQIALAIGGVDEAARENLQGVRALEDAAGGLIGLSQSMETLLARYQL